MDCRPQELLISVITDIIAADRHVAVGAASPIPGCASLLAQLEAEHRMDVTILHSRRNNKFTDGARELFDIAAQGRIDTFFLGGVQIDGAANINLVSALMYFVVPKVILFREEHSPRVLVDKVDFVSAPGSSHDNVYRPGGPYGLVTGKAVFLFDRNSGRFNLSSVHPGQSLQTVIDATGFQFDYSTTVTETPLPSSDRLNLLRQAVAPKVYKFYPEFAKRVFPDKNTDQGD